MPGIMPTRRSRQPVAGGFRPNPGNPLATGIDFMFSQRGLFYCRGPVAFAQANAPSLSAVAAGVGTAYASAQATTITGQLPPIADGQGYSYLAVYVRTSTSNVGQFIQADSVTRGFQFRSESGGAPSIIAFNTANTPFTATSSVSIPSGQMAVAVSTVSPTLASIYVNGILRGSTAISGTVRGQQTTSDFTIGNRGGGNALDGTLVLLIRWDQTLTAAEAAAVSADYWQLFQPQARQILLDAGGAAPVTGTFASTLADAVMAAAGSVTNAGAFASTLGDTTMAAAGSVGSAPTGVFASTLAGATMASSGQVTVPGALASTLTGISMAAAGAVNNPGTFASTLGGVTMAASGAVAQNASGTFASTLDGISMAAGGYIGIPPAGPEFFLRLPKTPRHVQRLS